jgi:chemotaxis protein MotB
MISDSIQHQHFDRDGWKIIYASLLTGVLAFFLLFVGRATNEAGSVYKFSDELTARIGYQLEEQKAGQGIDWLYIENAGTKGIKILIPSRVRNQPFFNSASDRINPDFYPYLAQLVDLFMNTDLPVIETKYRNQIQKIEAHGLRIETDIRIEGHSDQEPIRTERFSDNWDLSTARAYQVMQYLQDRMPISREKFSMAGYGSFHPLHNIRNWDENRRVEIYIKINMTGRRIRGIL